MPALASRRTNPVEPVHPLPSTPSARDEQLHSGLAPVRMTLYFSPEGTLHHARCRSPLQFRGVRAQIEGDFWCTACLEHVALPKYAVSQVPVEREVDQPKVVRIPR